MLFELGGPANPMDALYPPFFTEINRRHFSSDAFGDNSHLFSTSQNECSRLIKNGIATGL